MAPFGKRYDAERQITGNVFCDAALDRGDIETLGKLFEHQEG
jgi:hypothetical protein